MTASTLAAHDLSNLGWRSPIASQLSVWRQPKQPTGSHVEAGRSEKAQCSLLKDVDVSSHVALKQGREEQDASEAKPPTCRAGPVGWKSSAMQAITQINWEVICHRSHQTNRLPCKPSRKSIGK